MRHTGSWKLWTWVAMFLLPAFTCVTVRDKSESTCPILRTEEYQDDRSKLQVSVSKHRTSYDSALNTVPGFHCKIFPKGLPEEYSVAVMFRVRRSTKKERWFLWRILNQQNMPQISIVIDGTKKVIEFMFRGAEGDLLNYVFKNRELRPLFDRQWHKLGIGVQARVLSLYMDCNLIASRHTEEKDSVDFHGKTVIAARASDGKPVDCPEQDNVGSTTPSWVTTHTGEMSLYLPGKQELKDPCQCIPIKEEAGSPTLGSLGPKGDKGEPVMCTQLILLG
ncbi:hypothetical protein ACRRTK_021853 [Alexandromys fortis]